MCPRRTSLAETITGFGVSCSVELYDEAGALIREFRVDAEPDDRRASPAPESGWPAVRSRLALPPCDQTGATKPAPVLDAARVPRTRRHSTVEREA
jgi:hypothetical protein